MENQNIQENDIKLTGDMTCSAKYIFLDIVKFTHLRNVEAQSHIVRVLNQVVLDSVRKNKVAKEVRIFIPTGDGICIALKNTEATHPFDIHMRIALDVLELLLAYNNKQAAEMRRFQVRIGINANEDNLITDINEQENLAGAGISLASRIMDKADGNQILVGEAIFDRLQQRQKYMDKFKLFPTTDKHGKPFRVYQFIDENCMGLDIGIPTALAKKESKPTPEVKLTPEIAYYLAYAIKNRPFISKIYKANIPHALTLQVLLYLLAKDTYQTSKATDSDWFTTFTWKFNESTFEEQFEYYTSLDFRIVAVLQTFIKQLIRPDYEDLFEITGGVWDLFVNENGKQKLKEDFTMIWDEFDLENC